MEIYQTEDTPISHIKDHPSKINFQHFCKRKLLMFQTLVNAGQTDPNMFLWGKYAPHTHNENGLLYKYI